MLGTLAPCYVVAFFKDGLKADPRTFKSRASLQFHMRRHFGAGNWRQDGCFLMARMPYSGDWAAVAYIESAPRWVWCD